MQPETVLQMSPLEAQLSQLIGHGTRVCTSKATSWAPGMLQPLIWCPLENGCNQCLLAHLTSLIMVQDQLYYYFDSKSGVDVPEWQSSEQVSQCILAATEPRRVRSGVFGFYNEKKGLRQKVRNMPGTEKLKLKQKNDKFPQIQAWSQISFSLQCVWFLAG